MPPRSAGTKTPSCGRCGSVITDENAREDYNSLCSDCLVPHQHLGAFPCEDGTFETTAGGEKLWGCHWCGTKGSYDDLSSIECTHVYDACSVCEGHPYCTPDCAGMAAALTGDDVYLAGFTPT